MGTTKKAAAFVAKIIELEQQLKTIKNNFVPLNEFQNISGLTARTGRNYSKAGIISAYTINGKKLYYRPDLLNLSTLYPSGRVKRNWAKVINQVTTSY